MKKTRLRSSRCADISTPTLRKVREGWGTPSGIYASEIKSLGQPPPEVFVRDSDRRAGPPKRSLDGAPPVVLSERKAKPKVGAQPTHPHIRRERECVGHARTRVSALHGKSLTIPLP